MTRNKYDTSSWKWWHPLPERAGGELNTVQQWDEWFAATGDKQAINEWIVAKNMWGSVPSTLERWATIIELNRIDRIAKTKETPALAGVGGLPGA